MMSSVEAIGVLTKAITDLAGQFAKFQESIREGQESIREDVTLLKSQCSTNSQESIREDVTLLKSQCSTNRQEMKELQTQLETHGVEFQAEFAQLERRAQGLDTLVHEAVRGATETRGAEFKAWREAEFAQLERRVQGLDTLVHEAVHRETETRGAEFKAWREAEFAQLERRVQEVVDSNLVHEASIHEGMQRDVKGPGEQLTKLNAEDEEVEGMSGQNNQAMVKTMQEQMGVVTASLADLEDQMQRTLVQAKVDSADQMEKLMGDFANQERGRRAELEASVENRLGDLKLSLRTEVEQRLEKRSAETSSRSERLDDTQREVKTLVDLLARLKEGGAVHEEAATTAMRIVADAAVSAEEAARTAVRVVAEAAAAVEEEVRTLAESAPPTPVKATVAAVEEEVMPASPPLDERDEEAEAAAVQEEDSLPGSPASPPVSPGRKKKKGAERKNQ